MQERKRLFVQSKTGKRDRVEIVKWAANNNYDALVFSLDEKINLKSTYIKLAKRYELLIEAGGHDLSLLLPRRMFTFHRELFRMEHGKRKKYPHFCTTNPQTISIIAETARIFFTRSMPLVTAPRVFHLLPDKGLENVWCACPACRAFSPAEQNIIVVNTAADVLAELDPQAKLSFFSFDIEPEVEAAGVIPRGNMFKLKSSDN
jgi:hypothetical protein